MDPVFYKNDGWDCHGEALPAGWYFWDECWLDWFGPFATEWQARGALDYYVKNWLGA